MADTPSLTRRERRVTRKAIRSATKSDWTSGILGSFNEMPKVGMKPRRETRPSQVDVEGGQFTGCVLGQTSARRLAHVRRRGWLTPASTPVDVFQSHASPTPPRALTLFPRDIFTVCNSNGTL